MVLMTTHATQVRVQVSHDLPQGGMSCCCGAARRLLVVCPTIMIHHNTREESQQSYLQDNRRRRRGGSLTHTHASNQHPPSLPPPEILHDATLTHRIGGDGMRETTSTTTPEKFSDTHAHHRTPHARDDDGRFSALTTTVCDATRRNGRADVQFSAGVRKSGPPSRCICCCIVRPSIRRD